MSFRISPRARSGMVRGRRVLANRVRDRASLYHRYGISLKRLALILGISLDYTRYNTDGQ